MRHTPDRTRFRIAKTATACYRGSMADPSTRRDLKALYRLINQADLVLDTIPDPHPSMTSARESLTAALALARRLERSSRVNTGDPEPGALSDPLRDLSKARHLLRDGLTAQTVEECHAIIADSLPTLDCVAELIASPAVLMGKLGGNATKAANVARDPDYYKRISAMRKTRAGGRPRKPRDK